MADDPDFEGPPRAGRRNTDPLLGRQGAKSAGTNLPVPTQKETPTAAPFEAQLMGQGGIKRGLKGGPPVLDQAKSAYLGAEWSGAADRRPPKGRILKGEV